MLIKVMKCFLDGTQRLVEQEVPDNYFDLPEELPPAETQQPAAPEG